MWRDGGIALLLASAWFLVISAEESYIQKKVLNITVPRWVKNDTEQIMLDCEYDYSLNEQNFVVKWYLNEDPLAIYQWIPSQNSRMFSPLFQRHVDWEYTLDGSDNYTKYRRIVVNRPTVQFGGIYQCTVNSKDGHGVAEAKMDIYAPAKNITLTYKNLPDNQVDVTCVVEKIFPMPSVQLFAVSSDDDVSKPIGETSTSTKDNGLHGYDITVNALLTTFQLNTSSDTTLRCVVLIHEDIYEEVRERDYHPQSEISILEPMYDGKNNSSPPRMYLASLLYIVTAILLL